MVPGKPVCFTVPQAEVIYTRLWDGDKAMRELEVANDQLENRNQTIESLNTEVAKTTQAAVEASGKLMAAVTAREVSDDRVEELNGTVTALEIKVGRRFRLGLGIGIVGTAGAIYGISRLK